MLTCQVLDIGPARFFRLFLLILFTVLVIKLLIIRHCKVYSLKIVGPRGTSVLQQMSFQDEELAFIMELKLPKVISWPNAK